MCKLLLNKQLLFHFLSTRVRQHITFFQTSSAPKMHYKALFLLKPSNSYRHNYTRMRSTCCASTAFGAINASSPSCAVRGGKEREKEDVSGEWQKSPFMFVKEEERAVIITLEALDCNFSPLCVNLCIHQVFAGGLWKDHTLPASICLWTQQTN